jgi:hypothetical protein
MRRTRWFGALDFFRPWLSRLPMQPSLLSARFYRGRLSSFSGENYTAFNKFCYYKFITMFNLLCA